MLSIAIIAIIILFIWWNAALPFYKDRNREKLISNESECFSPRGRSIIYKNGNDEAVLMIHGYPTAPNMYAYTAKSLSESGYDVYAPLIPTFASDPEKFARTDFSQWFRFIDEYYLSLRKKYRKIYVIGVSMGGAMTLKLAEKYSSTDSVMDKIVVISAPVAYNCMRYGIITNPLGYFARTISIFVKTIGLGIVDGRPDGALS